MQKIILWIFGILIFFQVSGQRAKNTWKDYLSLLNANKVAIADNKIYCATGGGIFYYDRDDNSVNKLSMLNGLSDFGISTIAYSEENQVLVIAYDNSNIDLIRDSGIRNLPDIKRKQLAGDKSINNISFIGDDAYLSCSFGIVVLNLERNEVKGTYIIGDGGGYIAVNDVESDGQFLYAASDEGIRKADINSDNLLDYQSWSRIANIPHSTGKFNFLALHNGQIIANYTRNEVGEDAMYVLSSDTWNTYRPEIDYVYDMQESGDFLVITSERQVYVIDHNNSVTENIGPASSSQTTVSWLYPRSAAIGTDGSNIWIGDNYNGIVHVSGDNVETIYPDGAPDNKTFALYANEGDLWVLPGGRDGTWTNIWEQPHFQLYRDDKWKSFNANTVPDMTGFFDIVCMAADPADPDHIFLGSWGGGLLEFQSGELMNRFTNQNSPLQSALPQQPDEPFVRIGGLDFDSEGNLWITNSEVAYNLLKRTASGEWESFELPEVASQRNIGQMVVTQNNDKWILIPRGHDAYVVDKNGEQKKQLLVISYFNNGEDEITTRMNDVYSIAEDNDGAIWIGTSKGVAVYSNPQRIWQSDEFYASQPGLDLNDGIYHPLLETETVTAIAVDGGNRKWLGTSGSGVYLVSEDGDQELEHFTAENSALLSNSINSIAINQESGEVFFGTDKGLISYMGDATGGGKSYDNVYVYPNPVRETYDGPVTITGLLENTDIKITDISGNLVYKTTSLGGDATWDGKNLNGNRVKTGVYLVFCNNEDGTKTHITKLLFIH